MKFCPKCGQQVADTAKFCRACGATIARAVVPPVMAPPPLSNTPPVLSGGAATVAQEEEIAPPPPSRGIQSTFGRDAQGRVALVVEAPPVQPGSTSPAEAATPPGTLPPASAPWKFREQTGAWAGVQDNPIARVVRGALMHQDVYRNAAPRTELMTETLLIAAVIFASGFVSVFLFGWFSLTLFVRMAVLRILGWACAVWAIQLSAKSMTRVELPFGFWFRALVYAQVPLLLSAVPVVGIVGVIWAAVCTAAAIHDLTGRDTGTAIILTVIGGVASYLAMSVAGAVLP